MELRKKGFQLPEKIYFEEETLTDTYGKLFAGPLEKGFGTTIGNSLRRVLLSSIEGAAATAIRIPGLYHEFAVVPGIKEDAVDIVMNVKKLRFSLQSDKPKICKISATGPKEIKGCDIDSNGVVKVLNQEQPILTLDRNATLNMEITVEKGTGYRTASENQSDDHPIDLLAIDSIFTPIKKVNFWVESARVGQATDYDKLVMEIYTDGSVTPSQAVTEAANILIDYILLFSLDEEEPQVEEKEVVVVAYPQVDEPKAEDEFNMNLLKSVDELELSVRSFNCLKNASIETIAELVQKSENEMLKTKNFGRKSLVEIKEILESMNLHFGMKVDEDLIEKKRKELMSAREKEKAEALEVTDDLPQGGGVNET